jgi:hypothetical protein
MGLCLSSGPTWEEDTLNEINEISVLLNARDMFMERQRYLKSSINSQYLLNMLSMKQVGVYHD